MDFSVQKYGKAILIFLILSYWTFLEPVCKLRFISSTRKTLTQLEQAVQYTYRKCIANRDGTPNVRSSSSAMYVTESKILLFYAILNYVTGKNYFLFYHGHSN